MSIVTILNINKNTFYLHHDSWEEKFLRHNEMQFMCMYIVQCFYFSDKKLSINEKNWE